MKKTIFAILLSGACFCALAQKVVTITGTVTDDTKGFNKVYMYGKNVKEDSTTIHDGKFVLSMPFEKPLLVMLVSEYDANGGRAYTPYGLLIDRPGTIDIRNIELNKGLESGQVSGMESAVLWRSFAAQQDESYQKVSEGLKSKFGKYYVEENDPQYETMEKEREALSQEFVGKFIAQFVSQHLDSYAGVIALASGGRTLLPLEEQEALYAKLSDKMKHTEEGNSIVNYIQGVRNSAIGNLVKDFTLNNPEGKPLAFSSFKGKYVVIDFWASWCVPCKESFPHIKEVYNKFKGDRFEMYSISIDQDKAAWLKALKSENFPWPQSLDTRDISHKGFAVTGVPTTYLIGPDGKILAKEVGFNPNGTGDIEKMLNEVLVDKSAGSK